MSAEGVERRLTTILTADVVGYSRLMAGDKAGTLAQLKTHRKKIVEPKTAEYKGRVVKLMGDGTLMEFGSVVDAVNFAVDVQRAMTLRNTDVPEDQRVSYRIGINIGDVKPTDNAFIKSFNGKVRAGTSTSTGPFAGRRMVKMRGYRREYTEDRPHSSIRNTTHEEHMKSAGRPGRSAA